MKLDAVIADRGISIGDLVFQRGAKLHIPPLTRKQDNKVNTLNQNEIRETRDILSH